MKVQTNAGEVELTADMVRPGMRFRHHVDDAFTLLRPTQGETWETEDFARVRPLAPTTTGFLGCDPAIAAREDVERYGVAPGIDAAENGFARLPTGGAIDLAKPDNVRKGMLFRVQVNPEVYGAETRDIVAACDGNFGIPASAGRFLGCHPEIARREDCERFGIPERVEQNGVQDGPIDAGTHGFARLRGGGAVDLRREAPRGSVALTPDGVRLIAKHGPDLINDSDDFIGLDARYASPEDIRRLCCGALAAGKASVGRCTLAIGDHGTHEDIATGTRWPAKVALSDASRWTPVGGEACCACGGTAPDGLAALRILARNERGEDEKGALCRPCGERLRGRGEYRFDKGRLVAVPVQPSAAVLAGRAWGQAGRFDMHKAVETAAGNGFRADGRKSAGASVAPSVPYAAVRAWLISLGYMPRPDARDGYERFERGNGHWMCLLVDGRSAEDEHDVEFFAGEMRLPAAEVRAGLLATAAGLGAVALLTWICGMSLGARRRAAEAPLVALVKAVPSWANPVGWRAAVLAATDHRPIAELVPRSLREIERLIRSGEPVPPGSLTSVVLAVVAYRRAIAPRGPRPAPERKRGGRGVRLTVDDGRDD